MDNNKSAASIKSECKYCQFHVVVVLPFHTSVIIERLFFWVVADARCGLGEL